MTSPSTPSSASTLEPGTISVTGHGRVRVSPDRLVLTISLDRTEQLVDLVERKLTEDRHAVRDSLLAAAVPAERIRSLGMQIHPAYDWEDRRHVFRGFRGTETIVVRVPLEPGTSLSLVRALAQVLGYVHLKVDHVVSDITDTQQRALEAAVADARSRAETIAHAAGGRLGALVSYRDRASPQDAAWPNATFAMQGPTEDAAGSIAAADEEVEATVTGVWQLEHVP